MSPPEREVEVFGCLSLTEFAHKIDINMNLLLSYNNNLLTLKGKMQVNLAEVKIMIKIENRWIKMYWLHTKNSNF